MEEMLGSYAPGQNNEKKFPLEEAPSGMLARGKYEARSKFTDDDGHSYLDFTWSFEVHYLVSEAYLVRLRRVGISCSAIDSSGDAF
jgi:RHO protein GDP dissociation inhibitor